MLREKGSRAVVSLRWRSLKSGGFVKAPRKLEADGLADPGGVDHPNAVRGGTMAAVR